MIKRIFTTIAMVTLFAAGLAKAQDSATATKTAPGSEELKKWSLKYQNYTNGQAFEKPEGTSINHYFDLGRKVGTWTAAGVLREDTTRTITKEKVETKPGDSYVKLITPTLGEKTTVNGNFRVYAPTSDASRRANIDYSFEPRMYVTSNPNSKWEFDSILVPKAWAYSESTDGQNVYRVGNSFEAYYSLFSFMTLDFSIYPNYTKQRNVEKLVFNNAPMYPGFTAKFTENFTVSPYVEIMSNRPKYTTSSLGAFVSYKAF